jgi:hypothetical protein
MRIKLSSYALVEIAAVPVDAIVDGERAKVVEPETGRNLRSFRLESTESVGSVAWHVVNARTLAQGRSAPVDFRKRGGGRTG